MAKRFSIIALEDKEIFVPGYMQLDDVHKSEKLVNSLMEIDQYTTIEINILYCLFLDFETQVNEDLTQEELVTMVRIYDDLIARNHIYVEKVTTFSLNGLKENEMLEESY